jgi:hypothetical protein
VFVPLIRHLCQEHASVYVPTPTTFSSDEVPETDMQQMSEWCDVITKIAEQEYVQTFRKEYYQMICRKLGITPARQDVAVPEKYELQRESDVQLWNDLLQLMFK